MRYMHGVPTGRYGDSLYVIYVNSIFHPEFTRTFEVKNIQFHLDVCEIFQLVCLIIECFVLFRFTIGLNYELYEAQSISQL